MKCKHCDKLGQIHVFDDATGVTSSFCEVHSPVEVKLPSDEELLAGALATTESLAQFIRHNGRLPEGDEATAMGFYMSPHRPVPAAPVLLAYLDALAAFIRRHGRAPSNDELPFPEP